MVRKFYAIRLSPFQIELNLIALTVKHITKLIVWLERDLFLLGADRYLKFALLLSGRSFSVGPFHHHCYNIP